MLITMTSPWIGLFDFAQIWCRVWSRDRQSKNSKIKGSKVTVTA